MPCKVIFDLGSDLHSRLVAYESTDENEKIEMFLVKTCPGRLDGVSIIMDQFKLNQFQIETVLKWFASFRDCKRAFIVTHDVQQIMSDDFDGVRFQTSPFDANRSIHLCEEEVKTFLELAVNVQKLFREGIDVSDCQCAVESAFFLAPCGTL